MIKSQSLFSLLLILFMAGCSGGSLQSPWNSPSKNQRAQNAPQSIQASQLGTYNPSGMTYEDYLHRRAELEAQGIVNPTREQLAMAETPSRMNAQQSPYGQQENRDIPSSQKYKVALLLPLSGTNKVVGEALYNAAQLALFDVSDPAFELVIEDTEGTVEGTKNAFNRAAQKGARFVLGPLFSANAEAIKPMLQQNNMMNVTFSTDWTVAGGNTYVMGMLPFAQVRRVLDYTLENGIYDYGILAPQGTYGDAVTSTMKSYLRRNSTGGVRAELHYNPLNSNLSPEIRNFADYDARQVAHEEAVAALEEKLENTPNDPILLEEKAMLDSVSVAGDLPFQALMVPVGGEDAKTLVNLLNYYGITSESTQLIGTGLWDESGLAREQAFEGSLFAAPAPKARQSFEARYIETYGTRAPRIASLAYDATALAAVLSREAVYNNHTITRDMLTNPNGFAGIDGIFRFYNDGLIERGLALLSFRNGRIVVVDPAPQTFQ